MGWDGKGLIVEVMSFRDFHLIRAFRWSWQGLRAAWQNEVAFRQECYASIVLIPLAFYLGANSVSKALLIGSWLLVPLVEILNSALETLVDWLEPEQHPLAGRVKDLGSAAVLAAIIIALAVWAILIFYKS